MFWQKEHDYQMLFRPVVERSSAQNGLVPDTPENMLKQGHANNVTIIRGFNRDEGTWGQEDLGSFSVFHFFIFFFVQPFPFIRY